MISTQLHLPEIDLPRVFGAHVDRDMFMRFQGGGVGHKATHDWDSVLEGDRDEKMVDVWDEDNEDEGGANDNNEGDSEAGEEWEDDEELEWESLMVNRNEESGSNDNTDDSEEEDTPAAEHDKDDEMEEEDLYGGYGYAAL